MSEAGHGKVEGLSNAHLADVRRDLEARFEGETGCHVMAWGPERECMEAYTAEDASWKSLLYRRSCSRCDSVRWKPVFGKASLAESWNSMPNTFCSSLRIRGTHVSAALAAVDAVESVRGRWCCGRCGVGLDPRWQCQ